MEYILLLFFVAYALTTFVWGDKNWYYVISNSRRYVSAFIVYYATSEYITVNYWNKGVNILLIAQAINVIVTIYQNIVLKLHPDFCNGIFGYKEYNNAIQGMFCLVISVIAMVYYLDEKWSVRKTVYAIGTSCVVCAFSEIKAYYVLLAMAFAISFIFRCHNSKTRRKIIQFIIIGVILLTMAYKILEIIFPANIGMFFDLSRYLAYEQYGARGGAGRLTTISYIYNNVFNRNIIQAFIGEGLGSASNDFAYTIGKLFVSFGIIGLFMLFIWQIFIFLKTRKNMRNKSENLISIILDVLIVITLFVWNTLFTQVVFLVFWVLGSRNMKNHPATSREDCNW